VEAAGVPESFSSLVWSQAEAQVRGETSQDAWETRRRAQDSRNNQKSIDERARSFYFEAAFSDSLAIYILSLAVDFDYHDLRERDYPLLAAPRWPSGCATWRACSRPIQATSFRCSTGARAEGLRRKSKILSCSSSDASPSTA